MNPHLWILVVLSEGCVGDLLIKVDEVDSALESIGQVFEAQAALAEVIVNPFGKTILFSSFFFWFVLFIFFCNFLFAYYVGFDETKEKVFCCVFFFQSSKKKKILKKFKKGNYFPGLSFWNREKRNEKKNEGRARKII